jgi:hypothetical protein
MIFSEFIVKSYHIFKILQIQIHGYDIEKGFYEDVYILLYDIGAKFYSVC